MNLLTIFVTSFVLALSGALMPGPLLAVTIRESARRGAWTGPRMIAGHAIIEGLVVGGVALGFLAWQKDSWITGYIGLLGGTLMALLGSDMVASARRLSLQAEMNAPGSMHPMLAGVVVSLSNPYWSLWWVTIGTANIKMGLERGPVGILVFFVGHILADLAWYSFVSFGIARGSRVMSDSMYRGLVMVCGAAVFAFGGWFLWSGGRLLFAV